MGKPLWDSSEDTSKKNWKPRTQDDLRAGYWDAIGKWMADFVTNNGRQPTMDEVNLFLNALQERNAPVSIEGYDNLIELEKEANEVAVRVAKRYKLDSAKIRIILSPDSNHDAKIESGEIVRIYMRRVPRDPLFHDSLEGVMKTIKPHMFRGVSLIATKQLYQWQEEFKKLKKLTPDLDNPGGRDKYFRAEILPSSRLRVRRTTHYELIDVETGESVELEAAVSERHPFNREYELSASLHEARIKLTLKARINEANRERDGENVEGDVSESDASEISDSGNPNNESNTNC